MEEGSLRDGGAGFKVLRGGCSIFCHSLSPYVHPLLPFRAAATAALALRRVTGNYDNFEKLFSHVYATACTGSGVAATHPSVACPPPPPPCLAVFDANRLQLHEHGILLLRNFKLQRDLRVFFASLNSSTGLYRSIWVFARSETRLLER